MRMRAWLAVVLHAGTPAFAAGARRQQTVDGTRREVQVAARALQQAPSASTLELLEYTEKVTHLSAARVWAAKTELTVLERGLGRAAAADEARASPRSLLQRLARRLRLPRLEGALSATHFDVLLARAREAAPEAPARSALDAVAAARASQAEAEAELQELRALAREEQRALRRSRAQRAALAALRARVRAERDEAARLLEGLKQTERVLATRAAELRAGPAGRSFASLRGQLPMPTEGVVEAGFGLRIEPRFRTATLHKGVDIRALKGSPVRAVAGGTVVHAGWLRGYGNVLVLDHGGGFHTLMAHLDTIGCQVGQQVGVGQAVATVGDSGSDQGAYLYFEVRRRGEAQDPADWLRLPEDPSVRATAARVSRARRTHRGGHR